MKEEIKKIIIKATGANTDNFLVEIPNDKSHGDYSSNVVLVLAKKINKNPREVAEEIKQKIGENKLFSKIEVAGPGFINFFVTDKVFVENIKNIDKDFGRKQKAEGLERSRKIILDYTDPNPFKEFHIGHLMSNAIGESLSRIFEFQGAEVKRVCYQGDVGMHVAKAIWGKIKMPDWTWGGAYAFGAGKYERDETAKKEIIEINKKIYSRSDKEINKLYDQGKKESLKYFDKIYKKLGTKFDWLIFESETGPLGKKIVEKGLEKDVFEKGDKGAVIFKGEKYGLHTRVFINSEGLPTYEAKDLGLAEIKYKKYKYDKSFVVTGNEINEYFKVMLSAMSQINPKLAKKTTHIGHGMLRLPEGKMSSRTGKVITAEYLLQKLEEMILEKVKDREFSEAEKKEIAEKVAVGAIKYSILKQTTGRDIIFNLEQSVSFTGDSGAYLQYSYARAQSILRKAKAEKIKPSFKITSEITSLEKTIYQFPEAVEKASKEYQPHYIALYLTELASIFNNYYAEHKIVDKSDKFSPYRVALVSAFSKIMESGLGLLGIKTLNKM